VRQDETIENGERPLARATGAELAAFYDRRAAAALAYCSRLCAPHTIADAVEASFARVFEAAATGEATDDESLERRLRSAVRAEAAARSSTATAGVPARRLLERLADPNRGGACELMPALLAARADGALGGGDLERMHAHLRRCPECRTAEQRFNEAERAFDALAGDDAPALGRSLLAEMLADAPLSERRRFTRERLAAAEAPDWLDEIDWDDSRPPAPAVPVPEDALDFEFEGAGRGSQVAGPVDDPHGEVESPEVTEPEPEPHEEARADPATSDPRPAAPDPAVVHRDPAVTGADTVDFPAPRRRRLPKLAPRARRRLAITLLIVGVLLSTEAALTVLWKEPITAYLAARAQDDLSDQLEKHDQGTIEGADAERLAAIGNDERRAEARMELLAKRENAAVPAGDALGLLSIKSLDTEFVVVQSTESDALRTGPGHYSETPLPGEGGTVGVAGHRTTYEGPFRDIDELEAGDKVTMKMPYGLFTYEVERQKIVPADFEDAFLAGAGAGGRDGAGTAQAGDGEWLVLTACHPLYSASERILVYARLTDAEPLGAAIESQEEQGESESLAEIERAKAERLEKLGDRNLAEGMTGDDVKELQRLLGLPQTGTFGPETTAAVTEFQRTHDLPVVGRVGSQTKAALARRRRPPSRPPTPPAVPPQETQNGTQQPDGSFTQPGYVPPGQQPSSGTQPYSGETGTTPSP
jgi:sortase A